MPSDDEIRKILKDPALSTWLRVALGTAIERDPVDAANDAELLAIVLRRRAEKIASHTRAEIEASRAIYRAKYDGP